MPRAPRGGIGPDLLIVMLKEGRKKKKKKEIRFRDLYLSLPTLSFFLSYLEIGVKLGG